MKATIEFNLPEEQDDFDCAVNGKKRSLALWELNQWLRAKTKYPDETMSDDRHKAFEDTRAKLLNILHDNNLNL
jgi:hypothetical protein